eukprot:CAMPEP_0172414542 /NCGR_PEP_ID=MMETSP1064-20121228/1195_1 /TAXON_ID=202472 /ORGANISM="Aulacoseira subarctica , Strain CCAP 1002/5" /LENGTH=373 /DNA_ID=CAMNT_0013151263 /DNA_START=332 /DNA_END=1453 /DNA_ORIENTATION=-
MANSQEKHDIEETKNERRSTPEPSLNANRISTATPDLLFSGGGAAVMMARRGGNDTESSSSTNSSPAMAKNEVTKTSSTGGKKSAALPLKTMPTTSAFTPFNLLKNSESDDSAAVYAKKLKNRNKLNLKRKVLHVAFGLFFATLNQIIPRKTFLPGMTILTTGTLIMELMRFRKGFGWMNDALHTCLGSALRKQEMQGKFTGSFYYFLGITACAYAFPTNAATLGICQLALADPSASYFGQKTRHVYWSRIENGLGGFGRNKGILGFLGGALFCVPFNYRMLSIAKWGAEGVPGGRNAVLIASLALGVAGAFSDLAVPTPALTMPKTILGVPVPPFHVDDNFVVPIFSAFACTKIFDALGWSQELELGKFLFF